MSKIKGVTFYSQIWMIFVGNVLIFFLILNYGYVNFKLIAKFYQDISNVIPVTVSIIFAAVLTYSLTDHHKAILVFLRWKYPLPGHRAFSDHINDNRIDVDAIKNLFPRKILPSTPDEQNKKWYKIYRSIENDSRVREVHSKFLLLRDYTAISFLCFCIFGTYSLFECFNKQNIFVYIVYICCLLLQYVLVRNSAKNAGERFVRTVLAVKSTE